MKSFLSENQLDKLVMTIDGQDEKCPFKVSYDKNPMKQYYTTDSDWDPVKFSLEFKGDHTNGFQLIIEVGNVLGIFSKTTLSQVSDDETFTIDKNELKLIKSLIKNYTDVVDNYVYIK